MAIAYSKRWPDQLPERFALHDNPRNTVRTRKVILHDFAVGDVEDPMLYASFSIQEWQATEKGQWCMENCEGEIYFCSRPNPENFGYHIALQGKMSEKNYTFFQLKWADTSAQR
jgi:hypothetical protein